MDYMEDKLMMSEATIESNWIKFKELLMSTGRRGMSELIEWLESTDFKIAPASSRFHNSFKGGLVAHSLNVLDIMVSKFSEDLHRLGVSQDSVIITSLLHDLCKVDNYKLGSRNVKNDSTGVWEKVPHYQVDEKFQVGHGEKSVILAMSKIKLTGSEIAMIRNHMGFSTDDNPYRVGSLFNEYPESIFLSTSDMIASNLVEDVNPRVLAILHPSDY